MEARLKEALLLAIEEAEGHTRAVMLVAVYALGVGKSVEETLRRMEGSGVSIKFCACGTPILGAGECSC